MAEAIARHWIDRGLLGERPDVFIASAGTSAADGLHPTAETVAALTARGIEHDSVSKPLTPDMIRNADVVFCMTSGHVAAAQGLLGDDDGDNKITRLDPDADIEDPLGADQGAYDSLAERFMHLIPLRLKGVLGDEDRAGG